MNKQARAIMKMVMSDPRDCVSCPLLWCSHHTIHNTCRYSHYDKCKQWKEWKEAMNEGDR